MNDVLVECVEFKMENAAKVLDLGHVALEWFAGGDLDVVNSARVSFSKRVEEISKADAGLINFLMKNRHGTPFEQSCFKFNVKAPIFVAREWFRHRIGSFNEVSGRYVQLEEEFYIPELEAIRIQTGKPGAYKYEGVGGAQGIRVQTELAEIYKECYNRYQRLLDEGIAKEVARIILPVGIYTQWIWTVNPRSLMNFLSLRTHETAMFEIREYANVIETMFAQEMPITHKAWVANGKITP